MSIDPIQPSTPPLRVDPAGAASSQPRDLAESTAEETRGARDRIELSDDARQITELDSAERQAKVRELREQVDAGTYRVDTDGVARRMMDQGEI